MQHPCVWPLSGNGFLPKVRLANIGSHLRGMDGGYPECQVKFESKNAVLNSGVDMIKQELANYGQKLKSSCCLVLFCF